MQMLAVKYKGRRAEHSLKPAAHQPAVRQASRDNRLDRPMGVCLNRPSEKFAFEVYRDGELRAKWETFPIEGKGFGE